VAPQPSTVALVDRARGLKVWGSRPVEFLLQVRVNQRLSAVAGLHRIDRNSQSYPQSICSSVDSSAAYPRPVRRPENYLDQHSA
jgi:hypothetical protein